MKQCIIVFFCALMTQSCINLNDSDGCHYRIFVNNFSNMEINGEGGWYPDDTASYVHVTYQKFVKACNLGVLIDTSDSYTDFEAHFNIGHYRPSNKKLLIFIFAHKDLNAEEVCYYPSMAIQTYCVSYEDLCSLNWTVSFPPSSEMKDILMWPCYGYYSSGH